MRQLLLVLLLATAAHAEAPVARTFTTLPSSNGYTAVLADLTSGKLTHFREHLPATEEPLLDAQGNEVWVGNQPQAVKSRDLLYDAYFGLRSDGTQRWLFNTAPELNASGYAPWTSGETGGTGIVYWTQTVGALELTTYAFAPRELPRAGFVLAIKVRNTGTTTASGVSVFSLHNFHLGFGRPGVMQDLGESGETVVVDDSNGHSDLIERAFAGVVVTRALAAPAHHAAWNSASADAQNGFRVVDSGGTTSLPDSSGTLPTGDGYAHAFQFDLGDLAPGAEAWAGVAVAHHGDPFAAAAVQSALDAYVGGRPAAALVAAELAEWKAFQQGLTVPSGLSTEETRVLRDSAVMLRVAQVREQDAVLREWLTTDGEARRTSFPAVDGGTATLPATVRHQGAGAVLASLPPGEWTYAWPRDGAYAISALATLGETDAALDGLRFYLNARSGRFADWNELKPYSMPSYLVSLTRYHGFGVEETDFNDFGPNLEFDGFGLVLWALNRTEKAAGAHTLSSQQWGTISTKIADPLVALIDPATGLIRPDSSIWETHWNGRQRSWAYTNITAARGLCDAAELASANGDSARAQTYRTAAERIRAAIATRLTDSRGVIASNAEELASGSGYLDAAVLDAIAFGLFRPDGRIATATLDALDTQLRTAVGAGWSRNDDAVDHSGQNDLSPWGSEYDRAEWVITNLRGAVALQQAGRTTRSQELLSWVRRQTLANYGAVAETYDETTGHYKFNAPMIGFGAGAWVLAMAERGAAEDPACGAYFDESVPDAGITSGTDAGTQDGEPDAGVTPEPEAKPCGCAETGASGSAIAIAAALWMTARRVRRGLGS